MKDFAGDLFPHAGMRPSIQTSGLASQLGTVNHYSVKVANYGARAYFTEFRLRAWGDFASCAFPSRNILVQGGDFGGATDHEANF
jgi:hypothetical protein